mgnify:FL=1
MDEARRWLMDEWRRKEAETQARRTLGSKWGSENSTSPREHRYAQFIVDLLEDFSAAEAHIGRLRKALILHRADMHSYSRRPCSTCRQSAEALGIVGKVPDACARAETDRAAMDAEPVKEER